MKINQSNRQFYYICIDYGTSAKNSFSNWLPAMKIKNTGVPLSIGHLKKCIKNLDTYKMHKQLYI